MTCLEFQGLMIRYINGELSYKEKEQFMEHVSSCENCKDELEIYYIILNSMKQLDEDRQLSDDFHQDFLVELEGTKRELILRRKGKIRRRIAFPIVVGATVLMTGLRTSEEKEEISTAEQSVFEMKFRFYEDERHRMLEPNITEQILLELWESQDE